MTKTEFYNTMVEILKKEMIEQSKKANDAALACRDETGRSDQYHAHIGASNEAEKLLRYVLSMYVQE